MFRGIVTPSKKILAHESTNILVDLELKLIHFFQSRLNEH